MFARVCARVATLLTGTGVLLLLLPLKTQPDSFDVGFPKFPFSSHVVPMKG
jgi:hypothetical protein